jgi:hypothetical protein
MTISAAIGERKPIIFIGLAIERLHPVKQPIPEGVGMNALFRQNLVSRTVWPWQDKGTADGPQRPSLWFSLFTLVIGCAATTLFLYFGRPVMAVLVFGVALLIFGAARFSPRSYAVIEKFFRKFSFAVGQILTWCLLVPFFYIGFSFGRLVQKLTGKDPMQRAYDRQAETYWETRNEQPGIEQYRRQY